MKKLKLALIIIIPLIFYSCPDNISDNEQTQSNDDITIINLSELIKWEKDEYDYTQFYTNDKSFLLVKGAAFWQPGEYNNLTSNTFKADINKVSGRAAYGYGIIFCIQDEPGTGNFTAKNFYAILIRTDGYYQVVKVVDRKQHRMEIPGCDSNYWAVPVNTDGDCIINKGKNQSNIIKIITTNNDSANDNQPEFEIYINDYPIYSFEDEFSEDQGETLPLFDYTTGLDKYGFIVTIGPDEDFPDSPVDIRFKQVE